MALDISARITDVTYAVTYERVPFCYDTQWVVSRITERSDGRATTKMVTHGRDEAAAHSYAQFLAEHCDF